MDFEKTYSMIIFLGFIIGSLYGGIEMALKKRKINKIENLLIIFFYSLLGMMIGIFLPFMVPCFIIGIFSYSFVLLLLEYV